MEQDNPPVWLEQTTAAERLPSEAANSRYASAETQGRLVEQDKRSQAKSRLTPAFYLAPPVWLEQTTLRLTGDRGKIPLFPLPPNSPILLGFLDSVGIMEFEIFHYSHTLQKNEEQNPVREP